MAKTETGPGGWARKLDPLAVEKSDIELLIERLAEYAAKAGESGDKRAEDDRRALTTFAPLLEAAPALRVAARAVLAEHGREDAALEALGAAVDAAEGE